MCLWETPYFVILDLLGISFLISIDTLSLGDLIPCSKYFYNCNVLQIYIFSSNLFPGLHSYMFTFHHFYPNHLCPSHHHFSCGLLRWPPNWCPCFNPCSIQNILSIATTVILLSRKSVTITALLKNPQQLPITQSKKSFSSPRSSRICDLSTAAFSPATPAGLFAIPWTSQVQLPLEILSLLLALPGMPFHFGGLFFHFLKVPAETSYQRDLPVLHFLKLHLHPLYPALLFSNKSYHNLMYIVGLSLPVSWWTPREQALCLIGLLLCSIITVPGAEQVLNKYLKNESDKAVMSCYILKARYFYLAIDE